jgi:hypothetical protein
MQQRQPPCGIALAKWVKVEKNSCEQNQRFFRFDLNWPKKCEQKMKKIY